MLLDAIVNQGAWPSSRNLQEITAEEKANEMVSEFSANIEGSVFTFASILRVKV